MFRLVRLFMITSAIAGAAVIIAVIYSRQSEIDHIIETAERQNVALARAFANTIWPQFRTFVMTASDLPPETLTSRAEIREIGEATQAVAAGLPILKIMIYNLNGLTVFSSEREEIGKDKSDNPGFFSAASLGTPASKLTYRDTFSSFEGTVQDRDLVESYLPISHGNGPVEGVFELYTDVTSLLADIHRATINMVAGYVVVFALLYGTLFLIVRRSEATITAQYADIEEKNRTLEIEVNERKRAQAALKEAHDELEERVVERTRALTEEIAERRRAEDEARRHRDALAHFGRVSVMGEIASNLAHEINQPLTVISGNAQVCMDNLNRGNGRSENLLDAVTQISEQATRANAIIHRIRAFIRKQAPERARVDVNQTIEAMGGILRTDATGHGATIDLDLADGLPEVIADVTQIQQVVVNLAHNGMEAMSANGTPEPHLSIRTALNAENAIQVSVHNTGHAIAADTLEHMFDPFFTTKRDGLGMGLAISRSIVEAHGGSLWATTDGDTGTTLHFTIPTADEGPTDDH